MSITALDKLLTSFFKHHHNTVFYGSQYSDFNFIKLNQDKLKLTEKQLNEKLTDIAERIGMD